MKATVSGVIPYSRFSFCKNICNIYNTLYNVSRTAVSH
jgi:hypothetical protein